MPFYGINQNLLNPGRVMHIAGTRVLTADFEAALPFVTRITYGNEPSGYNDHGTILEGRVEMNFEIPKEAILIGRIPSPIRYYLGQQAGSIRFSMQEYQPEQIDFAAGGDGDPEHATGFDLVYIGGQQPPEKRILLLDDFDVSSDTDATQPWKQYWWTSPKVQGGGTFTRAENGRAYVMPMQYDTLTFIVGDFARLIEMRAIAA